MLKGVKGYVRALHMRHAGYNDKKYSTFVAYLVLSEAEHTTKSNGACMLGGMDRGSVWRAVDSRPPGLPV